MENSKQKKRTKKLEGRKRR